MTWHVITWHHMSSHVITCHHMSSHVITWHHMSSYDIACHHMTSHVCTHTSCIPMPAAHTQAGRTNTHHLHTSGAHQPHTNYLHTQNCCTQTSCAYTCATSYTHTPQLHTHGTAICTALVISNCGRKYLDTEAVCLPTESVMPSTPLKYRVARPCATNTANTRHQGRLFMYAKISYQLKTCLRPGS